MKALLINPYDPDLVTEVEIKDWRDIAPLLGCNIFTTVQISRTDYIYVDDEGLYSGVAQQFGAFQLDTYEHPLMGKGLVLGSTRDGESAAPKITAAELKERLTPLMVL